MAIVTLITPDFLPGFRALLNSIKRHTTGFNETLIVITDSDHVRDEVKTLYRNVSFVSPHPTNYKTLPKHRPALTPAFAKLDMFALAQDVDRLLYVDCDFIFTRSIEPLLKMNRRHPAMVWHGLRHGFNSGLVMLKRQPVETYTALIELLHRTDEAPLADQDILNAACKQRIISLARIPHIWNVTKRDALKGSVYAGLHFVSKKPWLGGEEGFETLEGIWKNYR